MNKVEEQVDDLDNPVHINSLTSYRPSRSHCPVCVFVSLTCTCLKTINKYNSHYLMQLICCITMILIATFMLYFYILLQTFG